MAFERSLLLTKPKKATPALPRPHVAASSARSLQGDRTRDFGIERATRSQKTRPAIETGYGDLVEAARRNHAGMPEPVLEAAGGQSTRLRHTEARVHQDGPNQTLVEEIYTAFHGSIWTKDKEIEDALSALRRAAFHGSIWTKEKEQEDALSALRRGGHALREAYHDKYSLWLEEEFQSYCNDDQFTEALSILWRAIPIANRIELQLSFWNDNEDGMMEVFRSASRTELDTYVLDSTTVDSHLSQLSDADAYEARTLIYPDRRVENVGLFIQESDNWLWDEENGVHSAILSLGPAERLLVWQTYESDLSGLLSGGDLARVQTMCVGEDGGVANEADALQARMELATIGMGTDDDGLQQAMGLAGAYGQEAQQIRGVLASGRDLDGTELSSERRTVLEQRLAQLEGVASLVSSPRNDDGVYEGSSFLGLAQGDISAAEFQPLQRGAGASAFQVAKQRILAAEHWYGNEWEVIYEAMEAAHGNVELAEGEDAQGMTRTELLERQRTSDAALLQQLRNDPELKPIFDALEGEDATRLQAIVDQDQAGLARGRILELLSDMNTDEAAILRTLTELSEADRVTLLGDTDFLQRLKAHDGDTWDQCVMSALRSGFIPTSLALDYGMEGDWDGTNEYVVYDALDRLTHTERDQLQRGYILAATGQTPADDAERATLDAWTELEARLDGELDPEEKDEAMMRFVSVPTPEELLSATGRLRRAQLMRLRQVERMDMRGNLTELVSSTDDTMELAHAQFISRYDELTEDGEVSLEDLAVLAALDATFNRCFTDFENASDLWADIAATVGAIIVGIAAALLTGGPGAATWPALVSWVGANTTTIAGSAVVGGIVSAGLAEGFGGDFRNSEDALRQGAAGAVEVVACVAASGIASVVMGTAGQTGNTLRVAIVRAVAEGTRDGLSQVGKAVGVQVLEGVIDGLIGGAMGDLVMTLTDARTFQQSLWGVVATAGQSLLRGGGMGAATGGVVSTGVVAAQGLLTRRLLRNVEVVEDDSLGRLSRVDYDGDGRTGLRQVILRVGKEASDSDLLAHVDALAQMQRIDRLAQRVVGTAGFEAEVEIEKLNKIFDDRLKLLSGEQLSPGTVRNISDELAIIEHNVGRYIDNLGNMEPGAGRIGQFDAPDGYPDLPTGPNGERQYTYFFSHDRWGIRRLEINKDLPPLHIEVDANGTRTLVRGSAGEGPAALFPTGTTRETALAQLTGPDSQSSLKPLYELARSEGLLDDALHARLLDGLPAVVGDKTEDWVRHELKVVLKDELLGSMFRRRNGQDLTQQESIEAMRRMLTPDLNSSDLGNMSEDWYKRFAETYSGRTDLKKHPSLPLSGRDTRFPDLVEGSTIVEVKSTREGLSPREVDQLVDYLSAAQDHGNVVVGDKEQMVDKVRLVFTNPEGATGSLERLESWLRSYDGVLEVELIGSSGGTVYSDIDSLRGALGQ